MEKKKKIPPISKIIQILEESEMFYDAEGEALLQECYDTNCINYSKLNDYCKKHNLKFTGVITLG